MKYPTKTIISAYTKLGSRVINDADCSDELKLSTDMFGCDDQVDEDVEK